MLRRRYHKKEKAAGKAKGRKEADAPVRNGSGPERGFYLSAENGFLKASSRYLLKETAVSFDASRSLCFTGHRVLSTTEAQSLRERLPMILEDFYQEGKSVFLSGGALGFDTLAALAVLQMRKKHPEIRLILALPCLSQADRWSEKDRTLYMRIKESADSFFYISDSYYPGCMQKRNRFLVESSDTCLCYMKQCRGGTWNTVSYAYDLHRTIINLASP